MSTPRRLAATFAPGRSQMRVRAGAVLQAAGATVVTPDRFIQQAADVATAPDGPFRPGLARMRAQTGTVLQAVGAAAVVPTASSSMLLTSPRRLTAPFAPVLPG